MQLHAITEAVNTHTTVDRTIKRQVAATAKRLRVPQCVVFNSLLATGLKVTHVADKPAAKTATARRKTTGVVDATRARMKKTRARNRR